MEILWKMQHRNWWTLISVGIGTFMSALDSSVVNTALPVIGRETGAYFGTLEWVVLIYILMVVSTLLVFGKLGDMFGRRRFFIAGFIVFTCGSALSGLAPSIHA